MRRGRYATAGCACALLALLGPQGGAAHEPSGTRRGYVSSVSEIRPSILGRQASILGAQERLLVRNWSGKVVIILGRDRRRLFRLDWEPAACGGGLPDGFYGEATSAGQFGAVAPFVSVQLMRPSGAALTNG